HEIDPVEAGGHARKIPDRTQVGVEIQRLAQADVDARKPFADRRRDRAFQRDLVAPDRFDEIGWQWRAGLTQCEDAGIVSFPVDLDAGRFEHANDGVGHFRADAVAWNQRDGARHTTLSAEAAETAEITA